MKYAHLQENGKLLGWYDEEIHGDLIPAEFEEVIIAEEKDEEGNIVVEASKTVKIIKPSYYDISKIPTPNVEVSDEVWNEAININANCYEDGEFIVKDFRTDDEIITEEIQNNISLYKDYLNNTDWYFARMMETGIAVPEDVLSKRAEYREYIQKNS